MLAGLSFGGLFIAGREGWRGREEGRGEEDALVFVQLRLQDLAVVVH